MTSAKIHLCKIGKDYRRTGVSGCAACADYAAYVADRRKLRARGIDPDAAHRN